MVERITAYRLSNGRIFASRWDAVQAETYDELVKFLTAQGLNEAQAKKVASCSGDLAMILEPLGKEIRKDMRERGG